MFGCILRKFYRFNYQKYSGPYVVISRNTKYFTIGIGLKEENITVDWLTAENVSTQETKSKATPTVRFALERGDVAAEQTTFYFFNFFNIFWECVFK